MGYISSVLITPSDALLGVFRRHAPGTNAKENALHVASILNYSPPLPLRRSKRALAFTLKRMLCLTDDFELHCSKSVC